MASLYFSERSFAYESCLSNLLWRRCSQIFSRCHHHQNHFRSSAFLSEETLPHLQQFILEFSNGLLDNSCRDVCMESTGKYWVPVFNLLEDELSVTIANPKWVKAVKGNKDDTKDSKWDWDLFRLGLVPGSYIPCRPIRILREFTRYTV